MPIPTAIALYFVLWWLCLFTVLPWGIRGQAEENSVVKGSEPGAPVKAQIKKKFIQTTILAAIVFVILYLLITFKILTWDTFSFIPDFGSVYGTENP